MGGGLKTMPLGTYSIERNMETQLDYGNWIRKKILFMLGLSTMLLCVLIIIPLGSLYRIIMVPLFLIILISFLFPLYSYVMFSQKGGRFQEKVYQLIIRSLGNSVEGRILDIGSGNGVLTVMLAQQNPEAEVTGMDYWGNDWEYSKNVCEKNAEIGQVESRVHFQKGDAAKLEFENNTFDAIVSNLTFHEVRSVEDKRDVVLEALRVVKPTGKFVFVDYFYETKYYGDPLDFEEYLRSMKFAKLEYRQIKEMMAIPILLRHPKIFGKVGILYGEK